MKVIELLILQTIRYKYVIITSFFVFTLHSCNQKKFIEKDSITIVKDSIWNMYLEKSKNFKNYNSLFLERGKLTKNDTIKYFSYYTFSLYYHFRLTEYTTASAYADSAYIAAKIIGKPSKISRSLSQKGISEFELGNYDKAYTSYLEALEISVKNKFIAEEIYSLGYISQIHKELEEYEKGIRICNKLLNLLSKDENKQIDSYEGSYINAINVLGICHRELGDIKKSIELFKKGIAYIDKLNEQNLEKEILKNEKIWLLSNTGRSYFKQFDYDIALDYLYKAKELTKSFNHSYFHVQLAIAEILNEKQEYNEVLEILDETIENAEEKIYTDVFIDIPKLAIEITQTIDNEPKLLYYTSLKNKITDTIYERNLLTRKLLSKNLSNENEVLNLNNKTISKKLSKSKILVFVLIFSILIIISAFLYNNSKNKKKFQQLLDKIDNAETEKIIPITSVSDEKANKILMELQKLEKKAFFLRKECSLHTTAGKLKTNTSYLSKIINTHKQQTFKEYINELRIGFVLNQIKENPRFRLYTIKAIADETGYKSVNTLNQTFKKHTQLNLSYYIKQMGKAS